MREFVGGCCLAGRMAKFRIKYLDIIVFNTALWELIVQKMAYLWNESGVSLGEEALEVADLATWRIYCICQ